MFYELSDNGERDLFDGDGADLEADGRVNALELVFGDTSGYQNLSFTRSLESVARSLYFLADEGRSGTSRATQVAGLVAVFLVLVLSVRAGKSFVPLLAMALGLSLGSALVALATPSPPSLIPRFRDTSPEFASGESPHVRRELAIMDRSHGGRFTLRPGRTTAWAVFS